MKVLFILGMYHPRYSANGLCCKNVIDECVAKGWEVSCIVNAYDGNKKMYQLDGAKIYPIKPRLSYRMLEKSQLRIGKRSSNIIRKTALAMNKIKLFLFSWSWPYIAPLYTRRFYKKACNLYLKERFDVVIGVYTPIDSLYAAYKFKVKFPEITFVPYYLDALAGGWGPDIWSEEKREKRLIKWERKINEKADAVISMKSSYEYHKNNPISFDKGDYRYFLDVPMLLSDVRGNYSGNKREKIALYAGSLSYSGRNPKTLLEIFLRICNKLDFKVIFAGDCTNPKIFQPYTEATGGKICYLGHKSHEEILQLEAEADFLLNIGNQSPYIIPCKIFEYMRFGKPIITTYSIPDEASLPYLKKYGYACFIDESKDIEEVTAQVLEFIEKNDNINVPTGFCQDLFYENTPAAFTDTIKNIMGEKCLNI